VEGFDTKIGCRENQGAAIVGQGERTQEHDLGLVSTKRLLKTKSLLRICGFTKGNRANKELPLLGGGKSGSPQHLLY